MSITDSIAEIIASAGNVFETDQTQVMMLILRAEKVVFLDTCFVTKTFGVGTQELFVAFEKIAGGKQPQKIVFVITELVLYELKDSGSNVLQEKNKEFFAKMSEYGFCLLVLKEETVCENIKPFMNYPAKTWNERFVTWLHDNVGNLIINSLIRTDKRMPYFGLLETGYRVPSDNKFVEDIIVYLKNAKRDKDSMAEELVCISLFFIFELTHGSMRNTYVFCTHDFSAAARVKKAIQTSYPDAQKQLKMINTFTMIQYMINEDVIASKVETINILKKIMGDKVKLIIRDELPFLSVETTITIEEAVDMMFDKEPVEFLGRELL